ncbi:hypothetical protein [Streptomyces griseus]
MSGRGRRAVLPPADHRVESPLATDGLVVMVVNKAGHKKAFDFTELPVPEPMQRSLAMAFAEQSRRWTAHRSAKVFWDKAGVFAQFVSRQLTVPEDLDGLTAGMLQSWRDQHVDTNTGRATLAAVRSLLERDPRLAEGPVAEELARRIPSPKPSKQSYKDAEREKVRLAAQRQFRAGLLRIRENTLLLERWRAGDFVEPSQEWRLGQVLDFLARTGDVPRITHPGGQTHIQNYTLLGGRTWRTAWGRLFLHRQEITALAVLLTDRFAWNASVYDHMPTPTSAPSAGEKSSVTYQVQIEKRRKGHGRWFDTENITDSGADSSGRLITQALEATAHARKLVASLSSGTDLLMTARTSQPERTRKASDRPPKVGPFVFGVGDDDVKQWWKSHGLDGSPFQRTRRTTVTREGRPLQHSQGTHESVYVLPDEGVREASREVFQAGAEEALAQARAVVFGGHLTKRPDPAHEQTATVDCEDETSSPWPGDDGGCGADFLLCLACPNAHVHPGHHPRLAHLQQQLASVCSALPDHDAGASTWRDPLLRLEDLSEKVGPAAWNAALARVSDADRAIVALLLKGDLAP